MSSLKPPPSTHKENLDVILLKNCPKTREEWLYAVIMNNQPDYKTINEIIGKTSLVSTNSYKTHMMNNLYPYQVVLNAYYLNRKKEGQYMCDVLMGLIKHPSIRPRKQKLINNSICWYTDKIQFEKIFNIKHNSEIWKPLNPSIYYDGEFLTINLRLVNYTQKFTETYKSLEGDGIIRTRNILQKYTKDGAFISECELKERSGRKRYHQRDVEGLEDIRLIDESKFLCTLVDGPAFIGMGMGTIDKDECSIEVLPNVLEGLIEKNWLPFKLDGKLLAFYWWDPVTIIDVNTQKVVKVMHTDIQLRDLRGGCCIHLNEKEYLFVLHSVSMVGNGRRYFHRFVYINSFDLNADELNVRVSLPWHIDHIGIEFVISGALIDQSIVLGYGLEDSEAKLGYIKLTDVMAMLY